MTIIATIVIDNYTIKTVKATRGYISMIYRLEALSGASLKIAVGDAKADLSQSINEMIKQVDVDKSNLKACVGEPV